MRRFLSIGSRPEGPLRKILSASHLLCEVCFFQVFILASFRPFSPNRQTGRGFWQTEILTYRLHKTDGLSLDQTIVLRFH